MKKLLMISILICVLSSSVFGGEWRSPYRSYSSYYGDSNGYLKSMIYGNTNKINQNSYKVSNNEIKISRNSVKTGQNEANIIQNSTKGLNNQNAIIQNAADIETLQSESNNGSSSEVDPFKYVTRDANGNIIGMSEIKVKYNKGESSVLLKFSDDFRPTLLYSTGILYDDESTAVYYTSSDCSGKSYKELKINGYFIFKNFKGFVISQPYKLFYAPKNSLILPNMPMNSMSVDGNNCNPHTPWGNYLYMEVYENIPSITGIYEYPFPTPITFDGMPTQ